MQFKRHPDIYVWKPVFRKDVVANVLHQWWMNCQACQNYWEISTMLVNSVFIMSAQVISLTLSNLTTSSFKSSCQEANRRWESNGKMRSPEFPSAPVVHHHHHDHHHHHRHRHHHHHHHHHHRCRHHHHAAMHHLCPLSEARSGATEVRHHCWRRSTPLLCQGGLEIQNMKKKTNTYPFKYLQSNNM